MRIGVLGHGFIEWGGGLDFLRLIIGSLAATAQPVDVHLLLPTLGPRLAARRLLRNSWHAVKRLRAEPVSAARTPCTSIVSEFVHSPHLHIESHQIDIGSGAIAAAARGLKLDAVLPSVQPLRLPPGLPWLGYIADFQHAHLPQFFSAEEIAARNHNFADMLQRAPAVIVNARAVAADIRNFLPDHSARVVPLPFSAAPNPAWFEWNDPPLSKYGITGPYFIISNQFWQHKDHLTAYRALARISVDFPHVQLVCTGETSDFRNPDHFTMLSREAASLGIASRLHVLGLVPKRDQIALMRSAIAVVQPTLFEGGPGGGSVFDAVSMGISAIVSDVPVNMEIDEPTVTFFKASDDAALATAMADRLRSPPVPRAEPQQLLDAGDRRRRACGETLLNAVQALRRSAVSGHST